MPEYDAVGFRPPAPVALVTVRSPVTGLSVSHVPLLLDSGADVSFLPREPIAKLVDTTNALPEYDVEAFDGATSRAPMIVSVSKYLSCPSVGLGNDVSLFTKPITFR